MAGKLIIVEGASASGKSTLLAQLAKEGIVIRGVGSQNPEENKNLIQESRRILGDTILNFKEALAKSPDERDNVFLRFTQIAKVQLEEAIRLKNEGNTVFLNRSAISVATFLRIPLEIAEPAKKAETSTWLNRVIKVNNETQAMLVREADGIVLLTSASVGGKEREGVRGLQELESSIINELSERISQETGIPFLKLDANITSVEEEVTLVKEFIA